MCWWLHPCHSGCSAEAALAAGGVTRKEQKGGVLAGPGSSVGDGSKPNCKVLQPHVRVTQRMAPFLVSEGVFFPSHVEIHSSSLACLKEEKPTCSSEVFMQ